MSDSLKKALSPAEKYIGFKRAFETYNQYLKSRNFIGAYVIGFSLFEDRIGACYAMAREDAGLAPSTRYTPLATKIKYLAQRDVIASPTRDLWLAEAKQRNELIHAAMWNCGAISKKHAEAVVSCARAADRERRLLKKKR